MKILKFFTLLWCMIETLAECPKQNSFPVMYDKERFLCAVRYTGIGSEYPIEGCNACDNDNEEGYKTPDDFNADAGIGHYYNLGSAIVRPGCHLYLYRVSTKLSPPLLLFLVEFLIICTSRKRISEDRLIFLMQAFIPTWKDQFMVMNAMDGEVSSAGVIWILQFVIPVITMER